MNFFSKIFFLFFLIIHRNINAAAQQYPYPAPQYPDQHATCITIIETHKRAHDKVADELASLKISAMKDREERQKSEQLCESMQTENLALLTETTKLLRQQVALKETNERLEQRKTELKSAVAEKDSHIKRLEQIIATLKEEHRVQIQSLTEKIASLTGEITLLKAHLARVRVQQRPAFVEPKAPLNPDTRPRAKRDETWADKARK